MRAFLATLSLCLGLCVVAGAAQAHIYHRAHGHHHHAHAIARRSSPTSAFLARGLIHMMRSARRAPAPSWPTAETMMGAPVIEAVPAAVAPPPVRAAVRMTRRIAHHAIRVSHRIIVASIAVAARGLDTIYQKVSEAAIAAGVPLNIAHAVVRVESDYRTNLRSSAGAIGVMQVLPATARAMGENPYSVDGNLRAGMKYLRLALKSSSNLCAAISGYNHGIYGRPYCTGYGRKVLAFAGAR